MKMPDKQLSIKLTDKKEVRGKLQSDVRALGHHDDEVPLRMHSEEEGRSVDEEEETGWGIK